MLERINKAGEVGLLSDLQQHETPPNAWTDGQNVRTDKGEMASAKGWESNTVPTVEPKYILPAQENDGTPLWLYVGDAKAYAYDGTAHAEVTNIGGDYTSAVDSIWDGDVLNGIPVVNNGLNDPQYWGPVGAAQRLQDLPGWPAFYTCATIKAYKNFLVALDIDKDGTRYENMVKWSSAADVGGVPASWDETDATLLAGENELSETPGALIDGARLRDQFIVYKKRSTYLMSFIGGQFVFSFKLLYPTVGILTRRCVTEFKGKHFLVTTDDVVVHDGQTPPQSIANRRVRDRLFKSMDFDYAYKTHVVYYEAENEIWINYPSQGSTVCDQALVWNINDGSWSPREIPSLNHMATVTLNLKIESQQWGDYSQQWNVNSELWSERSFNPIVEKIVGCASGQIYEMDKGNTGNGTDLVAYVERTGMPIGGNEDICMVKAIWPKMKGGPVEFFVGQQMSANDAVTWEGPYTFIPGDQYKINCRVTGRLHSVRIQTESDVDWRLSSYDIEYVRTGGR